MTSPAQAISGDADLAEAELRLRQLAISCLAVREGDRLVGVISRTDLLRVGTWAGKDHHGPLTLPKTPVREIMHKDPITVSPQSPIADAARLMVQHHVHRVFVVEAAHLVGVLSTRDILLSVRDARIDRSIGSFMSTPVLTVPADAPLSQAVDLLSQAHVHGVVVVAGEWPVGLFTQAEALLALGRSDEVPVEEVMSYALLCLPPEMPAHRAAAHMAATRARRVVVVSQRQPVGVLTGVDMAFLAV